MAFSVATHVALSTAAHGHVAPIAANACASNDPVPAIVIFLMIGLLSIFVSVIVALGAYGWESVDLWMQRRLFRSEQLKLAREHAAADAEALKKLNGKGFAKETKMTQCKRLYDAVNGDRAQFLRLAMQHINLTRCGAQTYYQNIKMHSVYRKQ